MNSTEITHVSEIIFEKERFSFGSLQEEIVVDRLCQNLLRVFCRELSLCQGFTAEAAGGKAHGADYFLRDFVISERRKNIFEVTPRDVTVFAGNWYIVKNLEPNIEELSEILAGIDSFFEFCHNHGIISEERRRELSEACSQLEFYRQRIDDFWAIEKDGYFRWEAECTLKD
ncbi:MAG: hypothetical protein JXB25_02300 [Deltaproteobacteria bacterium]|nr:hypothetical protein [Deltaproteobacteria bacterium]